MFDGLNPEAADCQGAFEPLEESVILKEARRAIDTEIAGLKEVRDHLDEGFVQAVSLVLETRGRVVVTGIGKSGLIGRKIAATLASTGTPAIFLHPVEAMHGDLGMVTRQDVVIGISNSGETQELTALLPAFVQRGIPVIAMTGNPDSTLGRVGRVVINTCVSREACSLGLAPTTSTTATLAVGDALAVVLLKARRFSEKDFLKNHPAGTLGERLKVQVREVMLTGQRVPLARLGASMDQVISEMDAKRLGAVLILDGEETLAGIVTDGDLRRALLRMENVKDRPVEQIMTVHPKSVAPVTMAADALAVMEKYLITVLPVVEPSNGHLVGIVHLHDLLGKGQFKFVA